MIILDIEAGQVLAEHIRRSELHTNQNGAGRTRRKPEHMSVLDVVDIVGSPRVFRAKTGCPILNLLRIRSIILTLFVLQ